MSLRKHTSTRGSCNSIQRYEYYIYIYIYIDELILPDLMLRSVVTGVTQRTCTLRSLWMISCTDNQFHMLCLKEVTCLSGRVLESWESNCLRIWAFKWWGHCLLWYVCVASHTFYIKHIILYYMLDCILYIVGMLPFVDRLNIDRTLFPKCTNNVHKLNRVNYHV